MEAKIEATKTLLKDNRVTLSELRQLRKDAADMLATLKKKEGKAQRDKNAFCSLKRSEVRIDLGLEFGGPSLIVLFQFSRDVLKEDFRTGLKDLDGKSSGSL